MLCWRCRLARYTGTMGCLQPFRMAISLIQCYKWILHPNNCLHSTVQVASIYGGWSVLWKSGRNLSIDERGKNAYTYQLQHNLVRELLTRWIGMMIIGNFSFSEWCTSRLCLHGPRNTSCVVGALIGGDVIRHVQALSLYHGPTRLMSRYSACAQRSMGVTNQEYVCMVIRNHCKSSL